jgi:hypothetical protein
MNDKIVGGYPFELAVDSYTFEGGFQVIEVFILVHILEAASNPLPALDV